MQGYGHGFLGDYEYLNNILTHPIFIPTHCPAYVTDSFRELAECLEMKLISTTPRNNDVYRLSGKSCELVKSSPATWLVVNYDDRLCLFYRSMAKANLRRRFSEENHKFAPLPQQI